MLTLRCPRCGKTYRAPEEKIGLSLLCTTPGCHNIIPVQIAAPARSRAIFVKPQRSQWKQSQRFPWKVLSGLGAVGVLTWLFIRPGPDLAHKSSTIALAQGTAPPPATGTNFVTVNGNKGQGELTIVNGTEQDAIVKLVVDMENAPGRACQVIYVRGGEQWTVKEIAAGRYHILFAQGDGWNARHKTFTSTTSCYEFTKPLMFEEKRSVSEADGGKQTKTEFSQATITLQPVLDGNAQTQISDPSSFASLQ